MRRYGWAIGDHMTLRSAFWGVDLELEIMGVLPAQPGVWLQQAYLDEALRARGGDGVPWNSMAWLRLPEATIAEAEGASLPSGAALSAAVDSIGEQAKEKERVARRATGFIVTFAAREANRYTARSNIVVISSAGNATVASEAK